MLSAERFEDEKNTASSQETPTLAVNLASFCKLALLVDTGENLFRTRARAAPTRISSRAKTKAPEYQSGDLRGLCAFHARLVFDQVQCMQLGTNPNDLQTLHTGQVEEMQLTTDSRGYSI